MNTNYIQYKIIHYYYDCYLYLATPAAPPGHGCIASSPDLVQFQNKLLDVSGGHENDSLSSMPSTSIMLNCGGKSLVGTIHSVVISPAIIKKYKIFNKHNNII